MIQSLKQLLRSWESGFCQTYNPPKHLPPTFDHRIGLYLGHSHLANYEESGFISFKIYVHEPGQFWPRTHFDPVQSLTVLSNQYKVFEVYIDKHYEVC